MSESVKTIGIRDFAPHRCPSHRTTVLKAWTIWPAQFILRSKDLGSLEPDKLADYIVIDKDYFTIPESEIKNIKTLMTVVGGQKKYRAPSF